MTLTETVPGLHGDLHRWRARVLYAPYSVTQSGITAPPKPAHGPWRRLSGQAVEADVRVLAADCDDGLDNDGDGAIDYLADPGCADAPTSESDASLPCDDGADNDGDSDVDYPADIGCRNPSWSTENPECDDGVDNADGDDPPLADWDGAGLGDPDPQCQAAWDKSESPSAAPAASAPS